MLCLAGSLAAHLLGYGWVASMRLPLAKKIPDGFIVVEQWPSFRPAPAVPEARKPEGETATARAARTRPAVQIARAPADVASEVQRKGILRALESIGRGPMARGLPGTLAGGDLASGLPDARRTQVDPGAVPERRGGGGGAPAVLGDLGTGGGGGSLAFARGVPTSIGIGASQVGSAEVDQGKLDSFVRARIGGLRACYETQLKLDQRRDGMVRIRFAILPTGELSDVVAAQNTLGSAVMADCLIRILRTWQTPFRPSEAVSVEYPFVFRPSGE